MQLSRTTSWLAVWFLTLAVLEPTAALAESYHYDAAGRLIAVTYAEGQRISYCYDAADRLTSSSESAIGSPIWCSWIPWAWPGTGPRRALPSP